MTISIKPTASGSTIEQDGSTILTVDGSGNITAENNLTIDGTTTATGSITSTGGIYLGGAAADNLLDDYEKGSFTPVLKAGATTLTASAGGSYVKTGNMVFASVSINNIVVSGSGNLTCTLPFTSNTLATGAVILGRFTNPSNATYAVTFLASGNDYLTPHWVYNNNQNASPIQVSHVTSSGASDMYFSIVYTAA